MRVDVVIFASNGLVFRVRTLSNESPRAARNLAGKSRFKLSIRSFGGGGGGG